MKNSEITDPLFREAVEAIDSGNITALESLVTAYPRLVTERLRNGEEGYFKDPWLIWFVADNPIRIEKMAPNIVDMTRLLIRAVKCEAAASAQEQLDYTLELVATGRISKECGVQIDMIDLLIDEGAKPGGGMGALAHGNIAAAQRQIERGGTLTLATAIGLDRKADADRLMQGAEQDELLVALTVAGFYGKPAAISWLLDLGADPNGYPKSGSGFHSHATPLHQAVCSGNLEAVKLLVEAGARLDARDKIYSGTPMGWALYVPSEEGMDEAAKKNYAAIAGYLREREGMG